eukprot:TRINITY_DN3172_c0_g1_i1.p1 TRINITY_DN3172_c0_g1~~TRINITY_DN3172_c0_g1_i1.p1  ORF type:complete len:511 (+),score=187.31 TRINITY_DN3172_c0_g1_i1:187-1719(+)
MLKMLVDPMAGIIITNDGNSILREIDVSHPAAKTMIELARAQDEEAGDGTTSVIVLASEMLGAAQPFVEKNVHPGHIVKGYFDCMEDALVYLEKLAHPIDFRNREDMKRIILSTVGTKFISRWAEFMTDLALSAVLTVFDEKDGVKDIDLKRYARIEKIPGGDIEDSKVLDGIVIHKDITHSSMRRRIENPRIVCLDSYIEYRKGESQTMIELAAEEDIEEIMKQEAEHIKRVCGQILALKPDIVVTEKGIADLADHYFVKAGVTCLRRLRRADNIRLARATGATVINRPEELKESDVGKQCGLFEIRKIGDDYFSFFEQCEDPKACSIILRGASRDVLNEVERNIFDAMNVARNIIVDPRLLPGGGSTEMALACYLDEKGKSVEGPSQLTYRAAARAFEVIPRTLAENCGANVIRLITKLRAKHSELGIDACTYGLDGIQGKMVDMHDLGIWEPYNVKAQTIKTAIESTLLLLRIDQILSGIVRSEAPKPKDKRFEVEELDEEADLLPE